MRDYLVLTAIGVRSEDGRRMILGVSVARSEAEPHWRSFLMSLKERGIGMPDSVTSDPHEGLKAALRAACNTILANAAKFTYSRTHKPVCAKSSCVNL